MVKLKIILNKETIITIKVILQLDSKTKNNIKYSSHRSKNKEKNRRKRNFFKALEL